MDNIDDPARISIFIALFYWGRGGEKERKSNVIDVLGSGRSVSDQWLTYTIAAGLTGVNRVKRFIKNIVEIFIVEINEKGRDVEEEGEIVQWL